jgi:hypothetical protein
LDSRHGHVARVDLNATAFPVFIEIFDCLGAAKKHNDYVSGTPELFLLQLPFCVEPPIG